MFHIFNNFRIKIVFNETDVSVNTAASLQTYKYTLSTRYRAIKFTTGYQKVTLQNFTIFLHALTTETNLANKTLKYRGYKPRTILIFNYLYKK